MTFVVFFATKLQQYHECRNRKCHLLTYAVGYRIDYQYNTRVFVNVVEKKYYLGADNFRKKNGKSAGTMFSFFKILFLKTRIPSLP